MNMKRIFMKFAVDELVARAQSRVFAKAKFGDEGTIADAHRFVDDFECGDNLSTSVRAEFVATMAEVLAVAAMRYGVDKADVGLLIDAAYTRALEHANRKAELAFVEMARRDGP